MLRILIYLSIGAIFALVWYYFIDFRYFIVLLTKIDKFWIIIAIFLSLVQNLIASYKLSRLLSIIKNISPYYILKLYYIGAVASVTTSFPLGGFSMAYSVKNKLNTNYHKVLGIFIVDYFLSVLMSVVLVIFGFFYLIKSSRLVLSPSAYYIIIFSLFLCLPIYVITKHLYKIINFSKIQRFKKLIDLVRYAKAGFLQIKKNNLIFFSALLIAFINSNVSTVILLAYYKAFGVELNYLNLIIAINVLSLINLIPGIPFKIGQYELISTLTLPVLLNIDRTLVFSVAFIEHTIGLSIIFILSWISLLFMQNKNEIKLHTAIRKKLAKKRKSIYERN